MPSVDDKNLDSLWNALDPMALIEVAIVIVAAWLINAGLRLMLTRLAKRFPNRRLAILRAVPMLTLIIWSVALWLGVVVVLEPDSTTLTAILGASAIAFGLAFQDSLKNVLGGISIVLNRSFQEGDTVSIGGHYGEVRRIGLRAVQLQTRDDNLVTIPNALVASSAVANANAGALHAMVTVDLLLPLGAPPDLAMTLAREAAIACPWTFVARPITVLLEDVAAPNPCLRVRVRAYVVDAPAEAQLASDVTRRAKGAFGAHGLLAPRPPS